MNEDFRYSIDLSTAQARAEKIIECIKRFRERNSASQFVSRERAEDIARKKRYYRWMYRTVLSDWRSLEELFRAAYGIIPIAPADQLARNPS